MSPWDCWQDERPKVKIRNGLPRSPVPGKVMKQERPYQEPGHKDGHSIRWKGKSSAPFSTKHFLETPAADNLWELCRRVCPDLGKPDCNCLTGVQGLSEEMCTSHDTWSAGPCWRVLQGELWKQWRAQTEAPIREEMTSGQYTKNRKGKVEEI